MIFAAGLGTRLKPLTDNLPKALVPINGKPLLEHVMLKLIASGFDQIIVNVHHFSQQIIDFLAAKNNFGIRIEISDESNLLLETGGGIKKAACFFDDNAPFLVHNVDILSDIDLRQFYNQSLLNNSLATLLVSNRTSSRYLLFDTHNNLRGWKNEKTGEVKSPIVNFNPSNYFSYPFAGIHVISPKIFTFMDEKWTGNFSIIDFYLSICHQASIQAYLAKDLNFIDVGKLDSLEKAESFCKNFNI